MTDAIPPLLIAPPPAGWAGRVVVDPEADRLARRSMVFGLLSFVINPLLLCTIIGVSYGRRALKLGTSHPAMARVGMVSGLASIVVAVVVGILVSLHAHDVALQRGLETAITRTGTSDGQAVADVSCPVPHDPGTGVTLICAATSAGVPVQLQVTFATSSTFRAVVLQQG